jgi:hypothetical protein
MLGVFASSKLGKEREYNVAIENLENQHYEEAYNYFKNNDYKDSATYLQETLKGYSNYLISNNNFYKASECVAQITDQDVAQDLATELDYQHAIYNYETGAFDAAFEIFKTLEDYKDTAQYQEKVRIMRRIQGEWILKDYESAGVSGILSGNSGMWEVNRGALKIEGWNAISYHGSNNFEEAGSCTLELNDDNSLTFKTNNIEYSNIRFMDKNSCLYVTLIKDSYYETLKSNEYPLTAWKYGDDEDVMAFERPGQDEISNGTAIPPEPEIGMTVDCPAAH